MHPSSLENMRKALERIPAGPNFGHVLDVGGRGLHGQDRSYRRLFPKTVTYDVADVVVGDGVTLPMGGQYSIPLDDCSVDLVISGQTLEHVANPFRLVTEMARVLVHRGWMVLIVPSTGPAHDERDYWRFQRDAFHAIAKECHLQLVTHWIDGGDSGGGRGPKWHDNTAVLRKA